MRRRKKKRWGGHTNSEENLGIKYKWTGEQKYFTEKGESRIAEQCFVKNSLSSNGSSQATLLGLLVMSVYHLFQSVSHYCNRSQLQSTPLSPSVALTSFLCFSWTQLEIQELQSTEQFKREKEDFWFNFNLKKKFFIAWKTSEIPV